MADFKIFDVAGSAMSAQSVRLNTIASNLANAETVSGSADDAYRARQPLFSALYEQARSENGSTVGVQVDGIVESEAAVRTRYMPEHPLADEQGYVYLSNVNPIEEMANMISASRSYQNNVEVLNTSKELLLRTLSLGQ